MPACAHSSNVGSSVGNSSRFDEQAGTFDERTGVPLEARARVADAVVGFAADAPRATLLEIGAGTGEIGAELATRVGRYVALDASPAMLERFHARAPDAELVVGDADDRWPVDEVDLVFGSRSLHLLALEHVVTELERVARPGACLLVGRVARDPHGPQARLREELQRRLAERDLGGRRGEERTARLVAACVARGWEPIPVREVASWTRRWRASDSLASWAGKRGLAGAEPEDADKRTVLAEVRAWAAAQLGDLDAAHDSVQAYTLQGARWTRVSS